MTLDDLSKELFKLPFGQAVGIHKDVYPDLFPPGEPDEDARARCFEFARVHGCKINNNLALGDDSIWFVKD